MDYQNKAKFTERLTEIHQIQGVEVKNPMLKYLNEIQKKKVAPKGLGFVHRKDHKEINLESFNLGDTYLDAFGEGIQQALTLQKLILRRNHLTTN